MSAARYALLSSQGTACAETVLTAKEYSDPTMRARVEAAAARDKSPDAPQPGTWTDVADNDYFQ